MKNQLKVGIVGMHRGSGFIQSFTTITETEVAAICDLNEDTLNRVAEQHGIEKRFTDYEHMLADEISISWCLRPRKICMCRNQLRH